ncbi:PAS domain S-box protein [Falsiroseomonas sp. E2-1-a20]|uniref:PAS domain S-box protein n=1 Tax=Falsiroseomonas sp. E2-1-a20 TaxID=3239300 RepID=UPI003F313326
MTDDRAGQLEREIAGLREELAKAHAQLAEMQAAKHPREQVLAFTDYAAVLEQIAEGVILADAAGSIVFINEAAARMHGVAHFNVTPLGYSSAYDLRTEDGLPYPTEDLPLARAVLRQERVEAARWRIRRPDGSEVLAVGSAKPVFDSLGVQTGAVLTLRDETARDAAEQALRQSEERFRMVFDQQFQFMAVLSPTGITLEINELPLRAAGIVREQVIGRAFWDTPFWEGLPEMREAWPRRLAAAAEASGAVPSEDKFRTASGEVRTADAAVTAVRAANGELMFFVIQATDTTMRREAEAALRESVAEFRAIFETAAAGVTEVDPRTGRYLRVNRRFCEIVDRREVDLLGGLGPNDVSHPDDSGINAAALAAIDKAGRYETEKRYIRPCGDVIWVRISAAVAARDAAGQAIRTVAVIQDITETKQVERRLALLVAELNHRAKNALATVQVLAEQTLRGAAGDLQQFAQSFLMRLQALARAHDLLTQHNWEATRLQAVTCAALSIWLTEEEGCTRIVLRMSDGAKRAMVTPRQAQALVLGLHELGTNATKHGALSLSEGRVLVTCDLVGGNMAVINWSETQGPRLNGAPARRGFGTRILERVLPQDLGPGSSAELNFKPAGLSAMIRVPLREG